MEPADNCRRAASEAVADVEPPQLHDLVETILEEASMVPGVLTVTSAMLATTGAADEPSEHAVISQWASAVAAGDGEHAEGDTSSESVLNATADEAVYTIDGITEGLLTRAAGVQLIYEGLRLTRTLAHTEPWLEAASAGETPAPTGAGTAATPVAPQSDTDGDLEILAADILVARGFYLLARTDAAETAVETVQSFGRDQTHRQDQTSDSDAHASDTALSNINANLERDILALAVETGAVAVDESPADRLTTAATGLVGTTGASFPPAAHWLGDLEATFGETTEAFEFDHDDGSLEDQSTDPATSATDP
ncbi:DUF7114 family protein [Natronolimnobius baerhuensis]|uniref:Uncharacterized protein n=1 Tax=Natronolimnobius baerhuensis TaxID=253108 RepID=A0A202E666_9EURY|nr:hypothetical protein [Natronolimnobius baerhuensis]OVE83725.1 hypothetical protein B2G88_14975 [Natronolimnobius baerhuensis]